MMQESKHRYQLEPTHPFGAEDPRGPVDLGSGPTGAERRPQVQI